MKTYLVPGLGGDKRMYEGQLKHFPNAEVLEFIPPLRKESMANYSKRLASKIDTTKPFNLLGVSLGGMMCMEMAKFLQPEKILLISSVKTRKELPLIIRFFKYFPIQKLIPGAVYLYIFLFVVWLKSFTLRRNPITKKLRDMARDADRSFVRWAVHQVVIWDNEAVAKQVYHIHGQRDYLFPLYRVKVDEVIEKGTHAMILTHVPAINDWLKKYI